jgi:hypothetical protein
MMPTGSNNGRTNRTKNIHDCTYYVINYKTIEEDGEEIEMIMGLRTADIIMGLLMAVLLSGMITEAYATTITNATTASTPTITEEEEEEEPLSFSANDTSTQNVTFYTGTDIKSVILGQLFGSNVTDYDLYENGTAVATFTGGTHSGIEVHYNHSLTAENRYRYENGTIYSPDGRELRIVLQD